MIQLRQHIPDFVTGYEPETAEIDQPEAFRDIPWVKQWETGPGFVRFAQAKLVYNPGEWLLMAEMEDKRYWVVASVKGDLGLPGWKKLADGQAPL